MIFHAPFLWDTASAPPPVSTGDKLPAWFLTSWIWESPFRGGAAGWVQVHPANRVWIRREPDSGT